MGVKIVEYFQNLSKIIDHNLAFLFGQLQLLVNFLHERKDVPVGTQLQDDAYVVLTAQVGEHPDHARMG